MSTPIDFSAYIMNGLNITNLTQATLLRLAFKLLKGTRTNFAELEYDFEERYKALSKKLDWNNPEGSDYPFDLTKPLPLVMNGNCQIRRWSSLEKKRAHIMIKAIDKQLKERMMMRSLEKFIGGRYYETDLRLL
ncbi:hypothetical protein Tco_1018426 [Tanacetum coccineum]|uniref:Uncharacterized protein n=1 Tax=Tanacetum coccineum TaxID=301880 RepID=A0ABQ5FUA2_9ASTR